MAYFAIAHVLQRRDGLYAVRSTEYPACEGRDIVLWTAREQFRRALSEHVAQMILVGEVPSLCSSLEEAESSLGAQCRIQVPDPERLPKTYDYAVIVEVDLSPDDAERLARSGSASCFPRAGCSHRGSMTCCCGAGREPARPQNRSVR
jgi:hypothetical protein